MKNIDLSIILPTYNESENIIEILKTIKTCLPKNMKSEVIVVDDNSPDGTGMLVQKYANFIRSMDYKVNIIIRKNTTGLSSAILKGIKSSLGKIIIVMDSDFSHPPQHISKLVNMLNNSNSDIVIASRYMNGGKITNWPMNRKLMSHIATLMAKKSLKIKVTDPMSGFFAFKRKIISNLIFDAIGYKLLLEILVKAKNIVVSESPYTFTDRKLGHSKLNFFTILNYIKMVLKLYKYKFMKNHEISTIL